MNDRVLLGDPFLMGAAEDLETVVGPTWSRAALRMGADRNMRSMHERMGSRVQLDEWSIGDPVEFEWPERGLVSGKVASIDLRSGELHVSMPEGVTAVIPREKAAAPRASTMRSSIRAALTNGWSFTETRGLIMHAAASDGSRRATITLEYGSNRVPSEDEVRAFVAARYPGARIIDGDDRFPGKLSVVLAFGVNADGGAREPLVTIEEMERVSAPDLGAPAVPGAQGPEALAEAAASGMATHAIEAARLKARVVAAGVEEQLVGPAGRARRVARQLFVLETLEGAPLFVDGMTVTATLSESSVPAAGVFLGSEACLRIADGSLVRLAEMTCDDDYASGVGPESTAFDDETQRPEAERRDTAASATTASMEAEAAPPAMSQLNERDYATMRSRYAPDGNETLAAELEAQKAKQRRQQRQQMPPPTFDQNMGQLSPQVGVVPGQPLAQPTAAKTAKDDPAAKGFGEAKLPSKEQQEEISRGSTEKLELSHEVGEDDNNADGDDVSSEGAREERARSFGSLGFAIDDVKTSGGYLVVSVTWDADAAAGYTDAGVKHLVASYVKAASTWKTRFDLGHIGRPFVVPEEFDPDAGYAVVRVRSTETRAFEPVVRTTKESK